MWKNFLGQGNHTVELVCILKDRLIKLAILIQISIAITKYIGTEDTKNDLLIVMHKYYILAEFSNKY